MSGIYHKWDGTVLTITSDSGTSSADLKGEKGDTGIRGPQGVAGIIVDTTGKLILDNYATMEYVDNAIAAIPEPLATKALDFSNWENGSFAETLEDDSDITHAVVFDEDGAITSIGGIEIWGLSSNG